MCRPGFTFAFQLLLQYPIKDVALLRKSLIILAFVLALFFIESIPALHRLSLGWCAFTGAILLLLISEYELCMKLDGKLI